LLQAFSNRPIHYTFTPPPTASYTAYNDAVNTHLRRPFGLHPQEIDYILFRIEFT